MRKILLGTTAVVGAALFAPGAYAQMPVTSQPGQAPGQLTRGNENVGTQGVAAPTPAMAAAGGLTIRLGGYFDFTGAMIYDDWDTARQRNQTGSNGGGPNAQRRSRYDFRNDSELFVFVDGRAANGMTYGAAFEFQMDNVGGNGGTGTNGSGTVVDLDEAWGYITFPNLGSIRFGQEDSAASLLQVRAPSAGIVASDGDWYDFIAINNGLYGNPYMLSGINDGSDSTKVIYLSPQFAGFDFGLSYAANSAEGERQDNPTSVTSQQRDQTILQNEVSAAVRYRGTFGPVGVNVGFGAMMADSPRLNASGQFLGTQRGQQVSAYTGGVTLSAYGFAFGGEFTWGAYNGTSVGRAALNPGLDNSGHYIVGLTYTMGPLVIGGNFGQGQQSNGVQQTRAANGVVLSERTLDDRKHTAWGVGAIYNLAPGLALYAIYQNINDENIPTSAPTNARYLSTPAGGGTVGTQLATFNGGNTRTINVTMVGVRLAF
ncbi:porin [Roseomonas rosulenta]|uniref:porin n=1 Tax=Roseomonas rosulenta TaxID=2748667 RepID=UPI0018DFBBE5|nr:porin [Roseomonas rosulenta]